jgi:hypothetical protein
MLFADGGGEEREKRVQRGGWQGVEDVDADSDDGDVFIRREVGVDQNSADLRVCLAVWLCWVEGVYCMLEG